MPQASASDGAVERDRPGQFLALIPARGGSKGIPGKNLVLLGGRPLLAWSIEQALATPEIGRVVVSTDDDEIASVARTWGAEVVERPESLAGDEASSESALVHALDVLESDSYQPDWVVFLQATSPLRRSDEISRAFRTLRAEGADSLFSAACAHGFVWRLNRGELEALTYDPAQRPRRQEIGEDLMENGSIYIFAPWVLRQLGNRLGGKIAVHRMDPLHSFQVDEPSDLDLMERLLSLDPGLALAALDQAECEPLDFDSVRLLVLDFDGVLTNDRVWVREDGVETVVCHRGDGLGLERLRQAGRVEAVVLSKEKNPVVEARCRKLQIECHQGEDDKLTRIQRIAAARGLAAEHVAYLGNDVNDLEPMGWCGVPMAVADARPEVLRAARYVTSAAGGKGAVREVCDLLLQCPQGGPPLR